MPSKRNQEKEMKGKPKKQTQHPSFFNRNMRELKNERQKLRKEHREVITTLYLLTLTLTRFNHSLTILHLHHRYQ